MVKLSTLPLTIWEDMDKKNAKLVLVSSMLEKVVECPILMEIHSELNVCTALLTTQVELLHILLTLDGLLMVLKSSVVTSPNQLQAILPLSTIVVVTLMMAL